MRRVVSTIDDQLVGRELEEREVQRRIEEASHGRGSLLLLAGEPGIGKTTMAQLTEARAAERGMTVTWGRSREDRAAPALWPWLQALRTLGFDSVESIRPLVGPADDDLWSLLSDERHTSAATDDVELSASRRFRLFDGITRLLDGGVCVLLDDVHRADSESLALLSHVSEVVDLQATLVVATYRDNEVQPDHPLAPVLAGLVSRPSTTMVRLEPLSESESRIYAESLLGDAAAESDVIEDLVDRSGGNPFFVGELVRAYAAGEQSSTLPMTIREVIRQRALLLQEDSRSALEQFAVLGREFPLDAAAYLAGAPLNRVVELLEPAIKSGLGERHDDQFRFAHALVRDALYETYPIALRRTSHTALALRPLPDRPGVDDLTDRAHHALAASKLGAPTDVAQPALDAARAAAAGLGYGEAIKWFEIALGANDITDRLEVMLELGDAQLRSGAYEAARASFDEVFSQASARGDVELMVKAALGAGRCVVSAGPADTRLVAMLEQAETALPDSATSQRARLRARRGIELYWEDGDLSRRLTGEALVQAGPSAPVDVRAEVMHAKMFCLRGPGRLTERVNLGHDIVALAVEEGLVEAEIRGRVWLVPELLQIPDQAAYRANIESLGELAEKTGQPLHHWYADLYRAQDAIATGSLEKAADLAKSAFDHGKRAGAPVAHAYHIGQQYLIRRDRGGLDEIVDEIARLSARLEIFATLRALLALIYTELGRRDEGAAILASLSHQRFAAVPHDSLWIATLCICAEVSFLTRSETTGRLVASLLEPHLGTCAVQGLPACFGAVDRYVGLALGAARRYDRAALHLATAREFHRRWGFMPFALRTELDLARIKLRRGELTPADATALRARVHSVGDEAVQHDLLRLAEEASLLGEEIDRHRPIRPEGPGGVLSARETEVLALMAAGATNKELARDLMISINTVERHVRNIYNKLGTANRAESVATYMRHIGTENHG